MTDRAPSPSETVPVQLQAIRKRHNLSQQQLSDRLDDIGVKLDRPTITRIEAKKRAVSIDEVFAFAYALGVSPLALLLPRSSELVTVVPGRTVDTSYALSWLRGAQYFGPVGRTREEQLENLRIFDEARTEAEVEAFRSWPDLRELHHLTDSVITNAAITVRAGEHGLVAGLLRNLERIRERALRAYKDIGAGLRSDVQGEVFERSRLTAAQKAMSLPDPEPEDPQTDAPPARTRRSSSKKEGS